MAIVEPFINWNRVGEANRTAKNNFYLAGEMQQFLVQLSGISKSEVKKMNRSAVYHALIKFKSDGSNDDSVPVNVSSTPISSTTVPFGPPTTPINKEKWINSKDYLIYNIDQVQPGKKAAVFDLDDTLIKPKSSYVFSESRDDWQWCRTVVNIMYRLLVEKYQIIIISNQKGITQGKVKKEDWMGKIEDIEQSLKEKLGSFKDKLPDKYNLIVLASLTDGRYRKPQTGIWDKFLSSVEKKGSFYCGDAGGRPARKGYNKDFSDTDLKFALNLGIPFIHRDEFVVGGDLEMKVVYDRPPVINPTIGKPIQFTPSQSLELIINVGYPASGKTTYTINNITPYGYAYINQDNLKTAKKCHNAVEKLLASETKCVVDNTNTTREKREKYIEIAQKYGATVRVFWFTCPKDQCKHNNLYRHFVTDGAVPVISSVAYNTMKIDPPNKSEGVSEVVKIPFTFDPDLGDVDLYKRYYS